MTKLDTSAGNHIDAVCEKAALLAVERDDAVKFEFNGTEVICQPGEPADDLRTRWDRDSAAAAKAYRESPEYKEAEARRAREHAEMMTRHLVESAITEAEMRVAKVPWPYTMEQLTEYVNSLVDRQHDYGTCVYAMSMAATAAFYFAAHKLGVSGFQSSCADLDILRRTRSMDGPFILIKAEDALYPQYDLPAKLTEAMEKWKPWLREQALANLESSRTVHPDVREHWETLAKSEAV